LTSNTDLSIPQHFGNFHAAEYCLPKPSMKTKVRNSRCTFKEKRDETATRLDTRVDLARGYRDFSLGGCKDTADEIERQY
jgi:hypothetical protein